VSGIFKNLNVLIDALIFSVLSDAIFTYSGLNIVIMIFSISGLCSSKYLIRYTQVNFRGNGPLLFLRCVCLKHVFIPDSAEAHVPFNNPTLVPFMDDSGLNSGLFGSPPKNSWFRERFSRFTHPVWALFIYLDAPIISRISALISTPAASLEHLQGIDCFVLHSMNTQKGSPNGVRLPKAQCAYIFSWEIHDASFYAPKVPVFHQNEIVV
ncbi:MAG: hypothetical protein IJ242_17715, partial [Clostridia bacterium]|nr:hypothetical protein [Clostridia bacterium]